MRRPKLAVPVVALASLLFWSAPAAAVTPRLPDLGMAPLANIRITRPVGLRLLRFDTTIVNVGEGPFTLRGQRTSTSDPTMTVTQRIRNDDRSVTSVDTTAAMVYSGMGDGHDHWHVDNLERYTLNPVNSGRSVGVGAKVGFCFWDSSRYRPSLPRAPASPVYGDCGHQGSTEVTMGLSVGWGDLYPWFVAFQWIDITGLANGDYFLRAHADPRGWFTESSKTNNGTWTKIRISANDQVTVLEQGPFA